MTTQVLKKSAIIGGVIVLIGFLYDVYFAGIPFQDAPPELMEQYLYHSNIAKTIELVGLGVIALNLIYFVGRKVLR